MKNIPMVKVPIGATAILQPGEEPVVVALDPKCEEFAELWFMRSIKMAPLIQQRFLEKSWLCLLNGCLVPELKALKASSPRYETRPLDNAFSERDGKWCVVDTHTMSKFTYPKGEYAVAVHVDSPTMALKVANALNESEGYPKATKYVKPQKPQRRR